MKYVPFTSNKAGFTLVEVLVAITILLLVITGPMRTISRANTTTAFSSEQVTAFFLAQEGLELVQKGRDDLVLAQFREDFGYGSADDPWDTFQTRYGACLSGSCGLSWDESQSPDTIAVTSCSPATNCLLHLKPSTATDRGVYTHDTTGNSQTIFTRTIEMELIGPAARPEGIIATSTVTWRTGSLIAGQKVELVTYITNVYDQP